MVLPSIPTPRRALVAAGLTHDALDQLLRSRRAQAPYRGVLVDGAVQLDLLSKCRAALATQDSRAAVAHESAAALLGIPWIPAEWCLPDAPVHVIVERDDQHRHRPGLRLHRALLDDREVVVVAGIRCTSPARTLLDLARRRDADRLRTLQMTDGALRKKKCSRADLDLALAAAARLRNVTRARDWFALARDGVDSPRETQLRLILYDGGVTDVEPDIRIHDDEGTLLARGDLGSRRLLLWGEYDGFDVHRARPAFRGDRVGDRWLERRGWHVMRFVDQDLDRPARTVIEWQTARAQAPMRIAAMEPHRSPEVAAARRALGLA